VTRVGTRQFSGSRYNGWPGPSLWRGAAITPVLALALASGGCSLSYQIESYFGGDKSDITGSVTPPPGTKGTSELPPDADLAYARAAVSEILTRGGKDASLPWENPKTGARGTITPLATAYNQDGKTCRDFLASYVKGKSEAWLQGEACKHHTGVWQVRTLKPWKSS
jgi:surface antigen